MAQTILAVEDDEIFADYLKTVLTEKGYIVLGPVATGENAIARARANRPDLVLMDINLAGETDGIAAAEQIHSFSDVPVIYLTGHSEDPFLKEARVTAPYGYLVKPVSRQELTATIEMALYRHGLDIKLKESEQRFRSLFETSRDSILLVNQETGQIVGANPAACELYGYSLKEFAALKITNVSAEPEKTEAAVRQSVSDVPFRLHRKKDGTLFPVEISGGYFTEGDLRLHTAFIRDITDRQKAEEELTIANFGIQSSISAIRFADLDGMITSVNDSFIQLWGYDRADEVVGRHVSELAMSGMEAEGLKALRSGHGYIGESRGKRKDGSPFDVQVAASVVTTSEGKPIRTMASFIDITERKASEEALRSSRLQLADAMELAKIVYWEVDLATMEFVFNDAFYTLYGTTAEHEGGYRMSREEYARRFLHPDDTPAFEEAKAQRLASTDREFHSDMEHRIICGDGEVRHVLARVHVIRDARGTTISYHGANQDITERRKAEEQFRQAQKMESIGTLAGGVAHDFNNILTVIMGLGNLMQMSLDRDDVNRPHIDQIVASSERAADLTQSLLAFSRKQRIAPEAHAVNGVVTSMAKLLKRLLTEDIKLDDGPHRQEHFKPPRPHPDRPGPHEPRHQCPGCHAPGRLAHHHHTAGKDRRDLHEDPRIRTCGRVCKALRLGHRHRHGRSDHEAYLRAFLHHERIGQRDRPWPCERLWHRETAQRLHHRLERALSGNHLRHIPASPQNVIPKKGFRKGRHQGRHRDHPHRRGRPRREEHAHQNPRKPWLHHDGSHRRG